MIRRFSKAAAEEELLGPVGIEFDLQSQKSDAESAGGLASSANAFIGHAVKCFIVGFDSGGLELCAKARDWLATAISEDERPRYYTPNATEAARLRDLCLANWLLGSDGSTSPSSAVDLWERYLEGDAGKDKTEVAAFLIEYLECGRTEAIRRHLFRVWSGAQLPPEIRSIASLCDKRSLGPLEPFDTIALLKKKTDDWLYKGHFAQFARWVKASSTRENKGAAEAIRDAFGASIIG